MIAVCELQIRQSTECWGRWVILLQCTVSYFTKYNVHFLKKYNIIGFYSIYCDICLFTRAFVFHVKSCHVNIVQWNSV